MARTKRQIAEAPTAEATQPNPPQADGLQRAESATVADLKDAKELREQLLHELASGANVDAQLESIEQEIRGHETKLARLTEAQALHARKNTREAREAQRRQTIESLKLALSDARALGEQVKEVLIATSELGARLSAIKDVRDSIYARMAHSVDSNSQNMHYMEGQMAQLSSALHALTLPDHFLRHLWNAGLGRTGVLLNTPWFSIRPLTGLYKDAGTADPDSEIVEAVERLRALANTSLKATA